MERWLKNKYQVKDYIVCIYQMKVTQLCLTLHDPMDYIVHGILQARILEWEVFPFFRGSSQPRDWTQVSRTAGRFFTSWTTREALYVYIMTQFVYLCIYVNLNIHVHMPYVNPWTEKKSGKPISYILKIFTLKFLHIICLYYAHFSLKILFLMGSYMHFVT